LGWDDASQHSNVTPRTPKSCPRQVVDADSSPWNDCRGGSCAGLKTLKSRMGRRQSNTASATRSSQIYDGHLGYGASAVSVSDMPQRAASAPRTRPKDEVDGSKPRKWKPAKNPMGPSGSVPCFDPAREEDAEQIFGRKRFPDMGAGRNRDGNAMEALRFFQSEEDGGRLGKLPVDKKSHTANSHDRASHRYYLSAEGKADLTPGKARGYAKASDWSQRAGQSMKCNEELGRVSESTSAGNSDDANSDCDSLPLGAEWSTFEGMY